MYVFYKDKVFLWNKIEENDWVYNKSFQSG